MSDMIMRGKYDVKVVTDFGFVPKRDDLISRAWVLAEYDRQHQGPPGGARKIMAEAPAVDAVPVVRCRNCKYSDIFADTTTVTMPLKCLHIRYGGVFPDWYCEHGEWRDSE